MITTNNPRYFVTKTDSKGWKIGVVNVFRDYELYTRLVYSRKGIPKAIHEDWYGDLERLKGKK